MHRLLSVLTFVLLIVGTAAAQNPPFEAVGRWQFRHTDGSPFTGRLMPDKTASTDFGKGEHGIWRWQGTALHMMYTDGWDDVLTLEADGRFTKRAWGPGADRCGPPTNSGSAERLSADPGPPL